jgi:hypothetical protein
MQMLFLNYHVKKEVRILDSTFSFLRIYEENKFHNIFL